MEVESPRQYSRKDLLGACSFMASTQTETEEREPVRVQDIAYSISRVLTPKPLPTISEEEIPESQDGGTKKPGLNPGMSSTPLLGPAPTAQPAMAGCVSILRGIVFLLNILFWVAGLILLGLGLWLLFDPAASDFFSLHSAHPGSFRIVAILLLIAGLIMSFTGCCGCCGAWKQNSGALCGFFFVLIIVFCLELAAALIAYQKQDQIRNYVESSMYDTIRNKYSSDSNYKAAFDSIQNNFECCGVKSYSDWLGATWDNKKIAAEEDLSNHRMEHGIGAIGGGRGNGYGRVPFSCCNENGRETYPSNCGTSFNSAPLKTYEGFLYPKGCADALYDSIYNNLDWVIGICVFIGALQLFGMVLAMALCCCFSRDEKQYNY